MPGNHVVIPLNPDELTDAESMQALEAVNLIKGGNKWHHQGKNLRKWEQ